MSALFFLLRTRFKNRLLAMLKSPGTLISMLVMGALLVMAMVSGNHADAHGEFRDIAELNAGLLVLYGAMFLMVSIKGLGKGASLFSMADVNLGFTSPISSRSMLLYGLLQQLGSSLLMGFFLAFQYGWARNVYGIGFGYILSAMLGYALTVFCAQLTAMTIYVWSTGNERRKRVATWGMTLLGAVPVLYILARAYMGRADVLASAVSVANEWPMSLFPVAGWMRAMVAGTAAGNGLLALGMVGLAAAYIALIAWLVTSTRMDYYEDVLKATEVSFSAVTAAKEGKAAEAMPANVKLGKTGLGGGWGASAFAYKHKLESRRARRFLLDPMSLIMLIISAAFALFTKELIGVLIFSTYMQFFTVSTGLCVRELLLPYVYLVPEKPYAKLLHCMRESFVRLALDAALLAIALLFILKLNPLDAAAFAIARFSFGLLFTSGMVLIERLFTGLTVKWLALVVLIIGEMILMIPGIVLAVGVSIAAPGFLTENLRILLLPAVANVPIAMIALFGSRNLLSYAELNNQ